MKDRYRTKIRIAICDDDQTDCELTEQMVRKILQEEDIDAVISCYESGMEVLAAADKEEAFHIYLLDVMMEDVDGISLAAKLREKNDNAVIIFISANREMAMLGYEVSAVRYLAKTIDYEKMREALLFGCQSCLNKREILLPTDKGESRVELSAIKYAETWNRGVRLNLVSGFLVAGIKISKLHKLLPEKQFVYCHRQVLVNLAYVEHIRYCELELKDGECLPVSKYRIQELKSSFLEYLRIG